MKYLNELLNVYWLQPETALLRTFDCVLMEKNPILQPSIDMGCGDGVLSYIMAGGTFPQDFDVYRYVSKTDGFVKGEDIYNSFNGNKNALAINADKVTKYCYTIGIDHKINLLKKTMLMPGFYKTVLQYNLNHPLPIRSNYFKTIFCNILYWLDNIDGVLSEFLRVLRKNGRMYIFVPNENFKQLAWIWFQDNKPQDYKYLNYFERGYDSLIKHCYNHKKWTEIFERNGFLVIEHKQFLSKPIMEIFNIGTRPIRHLLINMIARLTESDCAIVKSEWVKFLSEFFAPLIKFDWESDRVTEPAYHFFVLEKQ